MSPMPSLQLNILDHPDEMFVRFLVDGRDLADSLRASAGPDAPPWMETVLPLSCGDCDRESTVLGTAARTHGLDPAILFACTCGYSGCGSITARVAVTPTTITLSNFESHPRIKITHGPIEFARADFEAAIADLERRVSTWTPRPRTAPTPKPALITPPPPP